MKKIQTWPIRCESFLEEEEEEEACDCGHKGERATTLPIKIRVGDTSCSDAILSPRSFSSAKTYIILQQIRN